MYYYDVEYWSTDDDARVFRELAKLGLEHKNGYWYSDDDSLGCQPIYSHWIGYYYILARISPCLGRSVSC